MPSQPSRIAVGLIGPGLIGSAFLKQISMQRSKLIERYQIDPRVVAISGSKKMIFSPEGFDHSNWRAPYDNKAVSVDLGQFTKELQQLDNFSERIIVDSTASDDVPNHYGSWFASGCHVVTPNKKFGSGPLMRYKQGLQASRSNGSHFLYEATVGAGLPVISSLQAMLDTGDQVQIIEGVFSGTLSYIFNQVSKESSFSSIVAKAKQLGFTEPDPRDDLAGLDVARKVVVLARECGLEIELDDLEIESLVPKELQSVPDVDTFMKELPKFDDDMLNKIVEADKASEVLRYVGIVNVIDQKCEVGLRRFPKSHPLAGLNGTDNMIIFKTDRYCETPLVIQGPGAGAEVTAMGVFSDFVTIAKRLKERD